MPDHEAFEMPPSGQMSDVPDLQWCCELCGCWRPQQEFYVKGKQVAECRSCQKTRPLRLYSERERKERGKQFKKLVSLLAGEQRGATANAASIEQLNSALMEQFGGVEGLAKEYYEQYLLVKENNPGTYTALRALEGPMKIVAETSKLHGAGDPSKLDDDDLEAAIMQQILKVAKRNPEVARKVAAALQGEDEEQPALPPHLMDDEDEDDHGDD